ncbi:MAG: acyl-CoA dehydrogenase family protein [SAR324 cluster bacterium]|nr:acyl-CoA dehydrogenase family protein [SAR324 cluster bacterium]
MNNLEISKDYKPVLEQVKAFILERVEPVEEEFHSEVGKGGDRWQYTERMTEILEGLKHQAKGAGLWNFFLPNAQFPGAPRISNLDYAYLAEQMGMSRLAPEVFNCAAPDTGNMEVLERYGDAAQKEQWLKPLMEGKIRSCYAMTEPDVASSDATNIATRARLEGDEWVINGEKYFASGAGDPRCKIIICMVVTNPDAPKHSRQSQILVPMDSPGVEKVGAMHVFGSDEAPHGHMHLRFTNVRVPKENCLLGEGRGFEISQGRLGPGRIHHCMRLIGQAEKALELLCKRGLSRAAFGKELVKLGGNFDVVADSRIEIETARLLTLKAARKMDLVGNKEARGEISQIKVYVPIITLKIIDRAIQMYGGTGVSQWTPLSRMYANARTLRLADGPDEVHRMVVARLELLKYQN